MNGNKNSIILYDEKIICIQLEDVLNETENRKIVQNIRVLVGEGRKHISVHLGALTYINSVGLNLLISTLIITREANGALVLVAPSQHIKNLLEVTKLTQMFHTCQTEQEAINFLNN